MVSCTKAFRMFQGLVSFTFLVNVCPFLPVLGTMERLSELKLHAALNREQAKAVSKVEKLKRLSLIEASLGICHALLTWIPKMSASLRSIKITVRAHSYMEAFRHLTMQVYIQNSRDLNETVLETMIKAVPNLRSLHILGCPKISHPTTFQLINFSNHIEYLSISTWV